VRAGAPRAKLFSIVCVQKADETGVVPETQQVPIQPPPGTPGALGSSVDSRTIDLAGGAKYVIPEGGIARLEDIKVAAAKAQAEYERKLQLEKKKEPTPTAATAAAPMVVHVKQLARVSDAVFPATEGWGTAWDHTSKALYVLLKGVSNDVNVNPASYLTRLDRVTKSLLEVRGFIPQHKEPFHFTNPWALVSDPLGGILISDGYAVLRFIHRTGAKGATEMVVTVVAGNIKQTGNVDGALTDARFGALTCILPNRSGQRLYLCDSSIDSVRVIDRKTQQVSTILGNRENPVMDKAFRPFRGPFMLTFEPSGVLLVLSLDGIIAIDPIRGTRFVSHPPSLSFPLSPLSFIFLSLFSGETVLPPMDLRIRIGKSRRVQGMSMDPLSMHVLLLTQHENDRSQLSALDLAEGSTASPIRVDCTGDDEVLKSNRWDFNHVWACHPDSKEHYICRNRGLYGLTVAGVKNSPRVDRLSSSSSCPPPPPPLCRPI
jgi:hypothetical protein